MAKRKKPIEAESLDEFLIREHGHGIMAKADKVMAPRSREVLPTVLSLDIALNGGIPDGTICLLTGKPKCGKTTLCLTILRQAQMLNRPTYYFNIEKRCTPALLQTIQGLDLSELNIIPHDIEKTLSAENYLSIIERVAKTTKKAVMIVDSIAALSTMAEQEAELGSNKDMAGPAKLLSSFFRRTQQIVDQNDVIIIFISQVISNREPRGPKWVEKGGQAIQYSCSVWLKATWTEAWEKNLEVGAPDGHDVHITVQHSALGRPLLQCALPVRYGSGIDTTKDIVNIAENLGLIEKAGSWYSVPILEENGEIPKHQGLPKLCSFLNDNKDKLNILEKEIRDIVFPEPEEVSKG